MLGVAGSRATPWRAYATIAVSLRSRLSEVPSGAPVASEAALAQEYGVARNTVRRALAELARDGWVVAVPGRGRFTSRPGVSAAGSQAPAHRRIAEEVRRAIAAGEVAPGAMAPSESELAKTYGVSRATVRRALAQLEAGGLLRVVPGRGRVVLGPDQQDSPTLP